MTIKTRPVQYKDGNTKCIGYLAWDESYADPKPCVMVNHAWAGRDGFAEDKAIQMAALGYVGFALDNYGNNAQPQGVDECGAMMTPLVEDRAKLLKRLKAGYKAAAALDEVDETHMAVMGFCFGGLCTLDMARAGMDVRAAMSFHGLLGAHELPKKKIKAKVLVAHGWEDPMAPPSDVVALGKELGEDKCDWQLLAFGNVKHGFMNPQANNKDMGIMYNEDAARRAWTNALELLNEVFGMHGVSS